MGAAVGAMGGGASAEEVGLAATATAEDTASECPITVSLDLWFLVTGVLLNRGCCRTGLTDRVIEAILHAVDLVSALSGNTAENNQWYMTTVRMQTKCYG